MTIEWTLRRNCSLSPRQLALAYALVCSASLAVGLAFLLRGVWMVFAFTLVELSVVALALCVYARHATDHESILLGEDGLIVARVAAERREETRLDPLRTRVSLVEDRRRGAIRLAARGVDVDVGRFVDAARRRQVARELREALSARTPAR